MDGVGGAPADTRDGVRGHIDSGVEPRWSVGLRELRGS